MRRLLSSVLALGALLFVHGADHDEKKPTTAVPLMPKTGRHHLPIATKHAEAQAYFDQGMTWLYGFNHAEAVRSFRRAAELDPKAAMPHWGVALALGPNYNRDIDPIDDARKKAAYEAAQRAVELAKGGPAHERAYAATLARRYPADVKAEGRKFEEDYRRAMAELARTYPDDLDAQTLHADAIMVLNPWQLWSGDGKAADGTDEAIRILEEVLKRQPDHCGANHLYIHAIEASPWPERGLPSAERLLRLVPWAGHLVHMPAHIYMHTGDYDLAARANVLGIKADEEFFKLVPERGLYRMMYYTHNLHFLAYAHAAQGNLTEATAAADKLVKEVEPALAHMPDMEAFVLMPMQVLSRFHRWDDVLKLPEPPEKRQLSRTFRHFARATALAMKDRREEARAEQTAFEKQRPELAKKPFGSNTVEAVLAVAAEMLNARLADSPARAVEHLEKAVKLEAALRYGEPPDWYHPVRESLGAALLRAGKAAEAEQVFRDDLKRNRRNPRSLFGLSKALQAQQKSRQAELVELQFKRAWKGEELRLEDL